MKTKTSSILLLILFTFLTSAGQTLMKIGASNNFINWSLFWGLAFYGIGTIIFIIALKGGELSVLYPIIGLGFVWVTFIAITFLKEELTPPKLIGIILIISGVSILGIKR